jgi:hypothetical protein
VTAGPADGSSEVRLLKPAFNGKQSSCSETSNTTVLQSLSITLKRSGARGSSFLLDVLQGKWASQMKMPHTSWTAWGNSEPTWLAARTNKIKTSYMAAFIDILSAGMADSRVAKNLKVQGVGTYRDFDT